MTLEQKLQRIETVWNLICPHIKGPTPQDAGRWTSYPMQVVESAIVRAGAKFGPERIRPGFQPVEAYRYTTSVCKNVQQYK